MPELVAHEVQVSVSGRGERRKAHHLVQRDRAIHGETGGGDVHRVVHRGVGEPENRGFAADDRLVVAFGVADRTLVAPPVAEFVVHPAERPVFIRNVEELEPHVRHPHRQAVIEADSSRLAERRGESRHAADVFGDGHGIGTHRVDDRVGEPEIADSILIHVGPEVVGVRREGFP